MTLEIGPTPTAASTASTNDASAPKTKAHGGHGAGGGFMGILAALGTGTAAAAGAADALDPTQQGLITDLKAKAGHGTGKSVPLHGGKGLPGADGDTDTAADGKTLLAPDAAKRLASAAADKATTAAGAADLAAPVLPADATSLLAQSTQWAAATAAGSAPIGEPAKASLPAGAVADSLAGAKLAHPLAKPDEPVLATVAGDGTSVATMARTAKAQKDAAVRLAGATTDVATQASTAAQPDARNLQAASKVADVPMATIAASLAAVASTAAPGRREGDSRERSVFRSTASDSASVSQSYLPTGASTTSQNPVDAPSPTDTFVADKVAYWISNDVQNAQMKLDGIGDKPVEVSIRMQGNEAHIAFRTDELQAQAALENASVHLKDMLQREGLVLSGVSVGNSGAGGAGGAGDQQSGSRQGVRQQSVITAVQAPSGVERGTASVGRVAGSALDLFV